MFEGVRIRETGNVQGQDQAAIFVRMPSRGLVGAEQALHHGAGKHFDQQGYTEALETAADWQQVGHAVLRQGFSGNDGGLAMVINSHVFPQWDSFFFGVLDLEEGNLSGGHVENHGVAGGWNGVGQGIGA